MPITAARIDGRLVHGQVANLWIPKLGITRVIVLDDEVSKNEIEKSGLRMATPSNVRLSVLPVEKAAKQILAGRYGEQKLLLVAKKPQRFLELVECGVPLETINVGNMSQNASTKQITKSINVDEDDVQTFRKLADQGVHLIAQMVPQAKGDEFMELLERNV